MANKQTIIMAFLGTFLIGVLPSHGWGFQGAVDPALFKEAPGTSGEHFKPARFVKSFSETYDKAFRKKIENRQRLFSLYYQEKNPVLLGSPEALTDAERRTEARILARQALSTVLKETVDDVNVIYNFREYGRSMTSAQVKVEGGTVDFDTPSIRNAGNTEEPTRRETFRSSVVLLNNADFGLSLRTILRGSFHSHITYFLAGGDILGASVTQELGRKTDLKLEYRTAIDENRVLATLTLPLGY